MKFKKGDGVAIHLKHTLENHISSTVKSGDESETMFVEVMKWSENPLIGNIYRSFYRVESNLLFKELSEA